MQTSYAKFLHAPVEMVQLGITPQLLAALDQRLVTAWRPANTLSGFALFVSTRDVMSWRSEAWHTQLPT
jgi:hypothetical protein